MFISDVAFSTDWFLTIPGMLISCGVLLLILALIMFVASSAKSKKKKEEVSVNLETPAKLNADVEQSVVQGESVESEVAMVNPVSDVAVAEPMGPIAEEVVPQTVVPEVEEVAPVEVAIPEVVPVQPVEVNPLPSVEPDVISPVDVSPIPEIQPEIIPTETIVPEVEEVALENADINAQNLEKTSVNIYGGVAPVVPPVEEVSRPIYGGADPLEATQSLPKVDVHHEPYSGGKDVVADEVVVPEIKPIPEVKPVEVAPIPAVDSVVLPAEVEPQVVVPETPVTPEVVQIPDSEDLEQL